MRSTRRNSSKSLRREVAHAAARFVVEGNAGSFAAAKRKAAAQMGLDNHRNMPNNCEVQSAVIEYQSVFEGERHTCRIDTMRREALAAMQVLAQFAPRLVGPVLYGSACEYSSVTLHLYTDEFESVSRFLHERKIAYRLTHTTLKTSSTFGEDFPVCLVTHNDLEFELVILPEPFLVHPPRSSLDGRPYRCADAKTLVDLIGGQSSGGAPGGGDKDFHDGGP